MGFMLITTGMIALIVLLLVLLARAYPGSGADLVDWKPTRSYEVEAQLELDDISQMLEAQNQYRRRRGARELTEADADRMAREDNKVRERAMPALTGQIDELDELDQVDGADEKPTS